MIFWKVPSNNDQPVVKQKTLQNMHLISQKSQSLHRSNRKSAKSQVRNKSKKKE